MISCEPTIRIPDSNTYLTNIYIYFLVVSDCPEPIQVPYGFVNVLYSPNGSISEYGCLESYYLEGNRIVRCNVNERKWPVDEIPICGECKI